MKSQEKNDWTKGMNRGSAHLDASRCSPGSVEVGVLPVGTGKESLM